MKKNIFIITALFVVMMLSACGSERKVASTEKHEAEAISITKDFDGILLSVESQSDTCKAGEDFLVTAKVTNNTDATIYLFKNVDCGCINESKSTCSHTEIQTSIKMGETKLVDKDIYGKGEVAAFGRLVLEPGQSFLQKMNYSAQKSVADKLVPADTGEYTGTCGIKLCNENDDKIIDAKKINFSSYVIE